VASYSLLPGGIKDLCYKHPIIFAVFFGPLLFATGCASLPDDVQRQPSYALKDTRDTDIGSKLTPVVDKRSGESGFYLLKYGIEAFVARMKLADVAQKSLDVQYYIWHLDTTGGLLYDRLIRAADRGVRVRLLLDDLDTTGKEFGLNLLDLHPNIEVRIYNPFSHREKRMLSFITELDRVNRRMHNKSMTIDNQATIVGGRNIGNEYFGAVSASAFADLDVLAIGPVVQEVSKAFDTYWNSPWVYPVTAFPSAQPVTQTTYDNARAKLAEFVVQESDSEYARAVRESSLLDKGQLQENDFAWGRAILLYDAPSKAEGKGVSATTHIGPDLKKIFEAAHEELIIVSPYFVPGDKLVEFLGELVNKGTRVRILTNSLAANDVGVVHAGYMRYRIALLKRGVELYEFKPDLEVLADDKAKAHKRWSGSSKASLHAKTFAIDGKSLFVGSFNLDPRSVLLNTEMGVFFESPQLVSELSQNFDTRINEKAYRLELVVTPADESESGFEEEEIRWVSYENGERVIYTTEPNVGLWQRFIVGLLSIFVIESYL
jgi:putative cardiolipin synthase